MHLPLFLWANEKVEQLAANRLTIPQDAIASLLQRLVRHALIAFDGHSYVERVAVSVPLCRLTSLSEVSPARLPYGRLSNLGPNGSGTIGSGLLPG
jgi:hypothetical protein